jgi:hypothetical protein
VKQTSGKSSDGSPWLKMLDDLITLYYREVVKHIEGNAKLGDLIKMVELRHKLTPGGAGQKRFWKLVEEIRQGVADKAPTRKPGRTRTSSTRKKK